MINVFEGGLGARVPPYIKGYRKRISENAARAYRSAGKLIGLFLAIYRSMQPLRALTLKSSKKFFK